ncbi:hypothetical protein [Nonomuraea sp. NPDC049129]|uniref:hypothetical protein n=1 Tax=Nonomuraea sp. NPDC049129 TaxID=3155272 RepID=UPI0033ECDBDF
MVQASQFRNGGYMVDFYGAGYQVAERMGLAARLQELRYPVTGLTYVNHDGRQTSRFTLPPTFREVVSLLRSDLARTIADQVRAPIQYGTTIEAVHQDGDEVALTLADGTQRTADLQDQLALLFLWREDDPAIAADPAGTLRRHYGDLGWILPAALSRLPEDLYYDQVT